MIRKIIGIFILGIGLVLLLVNIMRLDVVNHFFWGQGNPVTQNKVLSVEGVQRVHVETDIASVHIAKTTGNEIEVRVSGLDDRSGNMIKWDATKKDETAQIEFRLEDPHFHFPFERGRNITNLDLNILLPDKMYDEISVNSHFGKIDLTQLSSDRYEVETNVGMVSLRDITGSEARVKTNVGAIEVENAKVNLDISSNAGHVEVNQNKIDHDLEIETNVGKVEITTGEIPSSLKLSLRSDVGRVEADAPRLNIEQKSDHQLYANVGNGKPSVKVKTDVGQISFNVMGAH